jgi:hypothetical protein
MKSRALKEEQFKNFSSKTGRKKKNLQDEIIDLSMMNELESQPALKAQEIIPEDKAVVNSVNGTQDLPPELIDNSLLEDELLASLEDQFSPPEEDPIDFNSDISQTIPERVLEKIANYLKEVTEIDKTNRQPWLDIIYKAKSYLGFDIEEEANKNNDRRAKKSTDNIGASAQSKTYDTTFSTSFLRLWATLRAELLPSTGPVGFKTDVSVDETYEIKGEMIKDRLNEYLTTEDKGFYPDYDRFLFYLVLYGCVFRKIYFDPISGKPISRFIIPEDFLVDNNCSSILESNRLTHIRYLSKREILLNMQKGIFRKIELDYLDNNTEAREESEDDQKNSITKQIQPTGSRFAFYETHEYLDLNEFLDKGDISESDQLPSPYVITRCGLTNKIVSIIPNWQEDDSTRTRINCFIHYNLFPGFDIYGLGLAQILGSNAKSLTSMQQMAIDSAIFQNFPGGLKAKGLKTTNNDLTILPGEFVTVETGNMSLRDSIIPLPYNGPSPALMEYIQRISGQTQELASTTEIGISQNNQNTPVGTTIAMLEVANRMQSAIMRTIHTSFNEEIQMLASTFNFGEDQLDYLKIIPISDPSVESSTQRIMKAESLLKIASQAPNLHNMREVYLKVYQALGITDIDKILNSAKEDEAQDQPPVDPALQVQMADIEQRRLEVESRERIAHLNIEADGYKTQMNIELDKAKMEQDAYLSELKLQEQEETNKQKFELELTKMQLKEKENAIELAVKEKEMEAKQEIELIKLQFQEREIQLKAEVEELRTQINQPIQEEVYYEQ